ncbi:uncharacterized protein EV422DRAFT_144919 [Fimicolochytrium jonesii]|uniref:uncharacterized protein n=1 Tax=Fimicolochytrium jonesii TaxID=1396493 RepID=UPI0022FE55C9|nr:uncharacterized protein EV422DRAFT_144919 [Fimicolochytrium jonesii]KAI8825882.1 hypothetical protein EV422DRAFT_144919 [Fimicolochytrium jonesii]
MFGCPHIWTAFSDRAKRSTHPTADTLNPQSDRTAITPTPQSHVIDAATPTFTNKEPAQFCDESCSEDDNFWAGVPEVPSSRQAAAIVPSPPVAMRRGSSTDLWMVLESIGDDGSSRPDSTSNGDPPNNRPPSIANSTSPQASLTRATPRRALSNPSCPSCSSVQHVQLPTSPQRTETSPKRVRWIDEEVQGERTVRIKFLGKKQGRVGVSMFGLHTVHRQLLKCIIGLHSWPLAMNRERWPLQGPFSQILQAEIGSMFSQNPAYFLDYFLLTTRPVHTRKRVRLSDIFEICSSTSI